jgi:hypothetical protein
MVLSEFGALIRIACTPSLFHSGNAQRGGLTSRWNNRFWILSRLRDTTNSPFLFRLEFFGLVLGVKNSPYDVSRHFTHEQLKISAAPAFRTCCEKMRRGPVRQVICSAPELDDGYLEFPYFCTLRLCTKLLSEIVTFV